MNVLVITGASDGIGAEMARQWAARGKRGVALVPAARSVDKLEAVAQAGRANGAQVLVQRCDVGAQADCVALIAAAVKAFGRIDTLVNDAGISAPANLDEVSDLSWYARLIIEGAQARRRDIVMSAKGKLGRWLKLIASAMVDRLALKALNRQGST